MTLAGRASIPLGSRPEPRDALTALAAELREEGPVIAPHVSETVVTPVLGELVAAGRRCAESPAAYAAVIEAVREGYLLHYGEPRLLAALDPDLRLLIGDHLYARGIQRLAELGDLLAVAELAELISTVARLDASPTAAGPGAEVAWLAACVTIAGGSGEALREGRAALRDRGEASDLWLATERVAASCGLSGPLTRAREAVGFSPSDLG